MSFHPQYTENGGLNRLHTRSIVTITPIIRVTRQILPIFEHIAPGGIGDTWPENQKPQMRTQKSDIPIPANNGGIVMIYII